MMKELYISPEMKVLCFAPVERLANSNVPFDDLLNSSGITNPGGPMISTGDDVDVDTSLDITLN